jgi:hypothetical protein
MSAMLRAIFASAAGVVVNVKTKQAFSYADPCVELGPTIAYDEKAHAESVQAVKEFVAATLRP